MPPQNQSQALEGEQLLDAITRHVFLVMLHISWPKMSYQIADAIVEVKVAGDGAEEKKKEIDEEFRTKPQWQLMPEAWRKKLINLEGRARSLVSNASINFAARGVSVLPVTRAQEIFSGLRTLRAEMEQYRDEFVAEYASILDNLAVQLDADLYEKVQGKLPESATVARKFSVVWAIIPAGGRGGISDTQLNNIDTALSLADSILSQGSGVAWTSADLKPAKTYLRRARGNVISLRGDRNTRQITDDEAADLINEARDQMHQFTHKMLEDMAREPRQILTDAADNLLAALRDQNRVVRNGTINQVREAFEMVEGFEFLAGPELIGAIRTCRERLESVTPQQLNSDVEIGARLAAGLQGVRDEAADTKSATEAVRQFRGIKIREKKPDRQLAAV